MNPAHCSDNGNTSANTTTAAARLLFLLIRIYRGGVSPYLPSLCRFQPSCSAYAEEAVRSHGALRGVWLSGARLLRCHPFGASGHDPVPPVDGAAWADVPPNRG